MLTIRAARSGEYDRVRGFYDSLIDEMQGAPYFPMWEKDIYPTYAYLRDCVERGELYVGEADGEIAAAMVVNGDCNDGYARAEWPTRAVPDAVRIIHILGVHPRFARRGLGREMVAYAIDEAKRQGCKAVRLDVLQGNLPAERLYRGMGFRYVDAMRLYYEDTDWMDFDLYERALCGEIAGESMNDAYYMEKAIALSRAAVEHGNEPFGAVLVKDGEIVYTNENQIYTMHDPTFHGEAGLIRRFCAETGITDLREYTLYSSCEPCFMCSGALVWTRLGRLVYAASNIDLEYILGGEDACNCSKIVFDHSFWKPEVTAGVRREESLRILKNYFSTHHKG